MHIVFCKVYVYLNSLIPRYVQEILQVIAFILLLKVPIKWIYYNLSILMFKDIWAGLSIKVSMLQEQFTLNVREKGLSDEYAHASFSR